MPPRVIDMSENPQKRKAAATPGRMAWDIASPIKLIPRSIKNTPTGQALVDSKTEPRRALCIKWKSMKGARKNSYKYYNLTEQESLRGKCGFRVLRRKELDVRGDVT